jgi:hypothetical protein
MRRPFSLASRTACASTTRWGTVLCALRWSGSTSTWSSRLIPSANSICSTAPTLSTSTHCAGSLRVRRRHLLNIEPIQELHVLFARRENLPFRRAVRLVFRLLVLGGDMDGEQLLIERDSMLEYTSRDDKLVIGMLEVLSDHYLQLDRDHPDFAQAGSSPALPRADYSAICRAERAGKSAKSASGPPPKPPSLNREFLPCYRSPPTPKIAYSRSLLICATRRWTRGRYSPRTAP